MLTPFIASHFISISRVEVELLVVVDIVDLDCVAPTLHVGWGCVGAAIGELDYL